MIENKTIKYEDRKFSYKIGTATVQEILQNNVGKQYPGWLEVDDSGKLYKYVEYDFFIPREVESKILKEGKIMDTVLKRKLTSKDGKAKFTVVIDPFGL